MIENTPRPGLGCWAGAPSAPPDRLGPERQAAQSADRRRRRRKFLITTLLRSIGFSADIDILNLFYEIRDLKARAAREAGR